MQRMLIGPPKIEEEWGTGLIPGDALLNCIRRPFDGKRKRGPATRFPAGLIAGVRVLERGPALNRDRGTSRDAPLPHHRAYGSVPRRFGGLSFHQQRHRREKRDWRIYRDFANSLIAQARRLYADDAFAVDLDNTVYALDTTTIDLSLKVFPWAHFRKAKAAVRMHTQIDLRG